VFENVNSAIMML